MNKGFYNFSRTNQISAKSASYAVSASNAPASGNDTEIQFNSGSKFTGISSFTFNYSNQSLQQGLSVNASGLYAHAEGVYTNASGPASHAEGEYTTATGQYSHAEGLSTSASGMYSHAEGMYTRTGANGFIIDITGSILQFSDSYGNVTSSFPANGYVLLDKPVSGIVNQYEQILGSNYDGTNTFVTTSIAGTGFTASVNVSSLFNPNAGPYPNFFGLASHAEGSSSIAIGVASHAGGLHTVATAPYQTIVGQYNMLYNLRDLFVVGGGSNDSNRRDVFTVSTSSIIMSGSVNISGSLLINGVAPGGGSGTPGGLDNQIQYNSGSSFGGVSTLTYDGTTLRATGSFTGSLTGSLFGTASWANSASVSISSSFAISSSRTISSSFATSASLATNAASASTILTNRTASNNTWYIPFVNSAGTNLFQSLFTTDGGSLFFNPSNGSLTTTSFTGSLLGTASFARSSSFATSASLAINADVATSATLANTAAQIETTRNSSGGEYFMTFVDSSNPTATAELIYTAQNITCNPSNSSLSASGGFFGTASWAISSQTASFLTPGTYQITSSWAVSASRAISSSFATNASIAQTASFVNVVTTASSTDFSLIFVDSTNNIDLSSPEQLYTAESAPLTYRPSDGILKAAIFQGSLSGSAATASYVNGNIFTGANPALTASYTVTSSYALEALITASVSSNVLTFTKGNGTQFNLTVNTGSGGGGGSSTFASRFIIHNGEGSITPITTGIKYTTAVIADKNSTITGWKIFCKPSASVTLDILKANQTEPTSADSITGSAAPSITNNQYTQSTTLTGWTTSVSEGDVLILKVVSNTAASYIQLELTQS